MIPDNNQGEKSKEEKKWYRAKKIIRAKLINNEKHYLIQWSNKRFKNSWIRYSDVSGALIRRFYINKSEKVKRNSKLK